jgi:hypothetical protein
VQHKAGQMRHAHQHVGAERHLLSSRRQLVERAALAG